MKGTSRRGQARKRRMDGPLILLLLGMVGATSFFLFYLGTKDVRESQQNYKKNDNIIRISDIIINELANSASLEFPTEGAADHCFFRRAAGFGDLGPSMDLDGFLFRDGALVHVTKNASGVSDAGPFRGIPNPLLTDLRGCEFRRAGSRLMRVVLKYQSAGDSREETELLRSVYLKNH